MNDYEISKEIVVAMIEKGFFDTVDEVCEAYSKVFAVVNDPPTTQS